MSDSLHHVRSDSMPPMATHIDLSSPPQLNDIAMATDHHLIRHDKRRKSLRMKIGSMFGRYDYIMLPWLLPILV